MPKITTHKPPIKRPVKVLSQVRTAKLELFCKLWDGTIFGTIELCRLQGISICRSTASAYCRDHRFIEIQREQRNLAPGEGIWTMDEIKRFYTRVASGIEPEGYKLVIVTEPIIPGEDDWIEGGNAQQFRKIDRYVPFYPGMSDRRGAADSLAKTQGGFLDKLEVSGQVSVLDLLDDDLKGAKQVIDVKPQLLQVVDTTSQVVDNVKEYENLL